MIPTRQLSSVSCHLSSKVCANSHNSPLERLPIFVRRWICASFVLLLTDHLSSQPPSSQTERQAILAYLVFALLSSTTIYYRQSIFPCMHHYRLLVNNPSLLSVCTKLCFLTPTTRIYTPDNPLPVNFYQVLM